MSGLGDRSWTHAWKRVVGDNASPRKRGNAFESSRLADAGWDRMESRARRWAAGGLLLGAVLGVAAFAPARWLAGAITQATGHRLTLAQAQGTLWNGSALVMLTGGEGSKDASVLPGRLKWRLGLRGLGMVLQADHACCLDGTLEIEWARTWSTSRLKVMPQGTAIGRWPNPWLAGLGTPWNTLQLGGSTRLIATGLQFENRGQGWVMQGQLDAEMMGVSSRISPLPVLGNYRLSVLGDASGATLGQLRLSTMDGPLQLSANGDWGRKGLRLLGEARAATPNDLPALQNLLNIIGRRDGDRSVLSIGSPT